MQEGDYCLIEKKTSKLLRKEAECCSQNPNVFNFIEEGQEAGVQDIQDLGEQFYI